MRQARPEARFLAAPWAERHPASAYGAHTELVLREAGLDAPARDALRRGGKFGPEANAEREATG